MKSSLTVFFLIILFQMVSALLLRRFSSSSLKGSSPAAAAKVFTDFTIKSADETTDVPMDELRGKVERNLFLSIILQ